MKKSIKKDSIDHGKYKRLRAQPHSKEALRQALENLKSWGLYHEDEPFLPGERALILELLGLEQPGELEALCKDSTEFKHLREDKQSPYPTH